MKVQIERSKEFVAKLMIETGVNHKQSIHVGVDPASLSKEVREAIIKYHEKYPETINSFWYDKNYIGPAALAKAYRYTFDTRDKGAADRLEVLDNKHGLWRCHTIFNCMDACPKRIKITQHISNLKKKVIAEKY